MPSRHTGRGLGYDLDSKKASDLKKVAIGALILGVFAVPIFRSGGRTGLTFVGWLVNHTIFGPPIEYVPEEDYTRELEGVEMPKQLSSASQLERVRAYYQISEPSARELLSHQASTRRDYCPEWKREDAAY